MKTLAIAALCGAVGLAACTSTGQLTPSVQAAVDQYYNIACSGSGVVPALQPAVNSTRPTIVAAYNAVVSMCANGAPDNLITAGLDIADVENLLVAYHVLTPAKAARIRARYHLR